MQNTTPDDFDVDLESRTVTHRATGTRFSFYAYHSEADWLASDTATCHRTDTSPADLGAMIQRAKAAAIAKGMTADRP